MADTIGPVAVVPGIPAVLGPFTPTPGATGHALVFNVGAWAGSRLLVECEISTDSGQVYRVIGSVLYGGPASAWANKTGGAVSAIAPQFLRPSDPPANAATRVRFRVTAQDGAFASSGGSYDSQ